MRVSIDVVGVREVVRELRKLHRRERAARLSALGRTSSLARGWIRRAIVAEEHVPLKTTRKRVAWFWKSRHIDAPVTKLWIGTRYPVTPAEARSVRRPVPLHPAAVEAMDNATRRFITQFVNDYRGKMRRYFRR